MHICRTHTTVDIKLIHSVPQSDRTGHCTPDRLPGEEVAEHEGQVLVWTFKGVLNGGHGGIF